MQAHFRPVFRKQLTGAPTANDDCGPAAARHALGRLSLGNHDVPIVKIRSRMKLPTGQASINNVSAFFAAQGLHIQVFTRSDHFSVADLRTHLANGGFAVCLGDYEKVPANLKGDLEFQENHFIMVNELNPTINGQVFEGVLVYDSLDDGRKDPPTGRRAPRGPIVWPFAVLESYLVNLSNAPDNDITVAIFPRRRVRRLDQNPVNVQPAPSTAPAPIGTWLSGELEHGGTFFGDPVNGDKRWFQVWWPEGAVRAFVPAAAVLESTSF
jgi:hypothetical protein